jgi:hypothetical protein
MTHANKKKLLAKNAGLWAMAALLSFVLPMIVESLADGPATFGKMMAQMFPLLATILISNNLLSIGMGPASDEAPAGDAT